MEYVRERGTFDELPFDEILAEFRATYPRIFEQRGSSGRSRFPAGISKP